MAWKNLSVLDSSVGSYSNGVQHDRHGPCDARFDEPSPASLEEKPHGPVQPEGFQNDDYEIALVRCSNLTRRTGSLVQPTPTMEGVLLLRLTWREFFDRIRGELSQSSSVERHMITRFGEVCVNFLTMEISRSTRPVALTALEFKLLRFFIRTPERVLSRKELLNEVWGYNNYPSTRTVDNHICMLRQKLESTPTRPVHFLTVHGMGYKFVP